MKVVLLALTVLSLAAVVPGAAEAHIGTFACSTSWDFESDPNHQHVCVNVWYVVDAITSGTLA